jgi:hypothetical protein
MARLKLRTDKDGHIFDEITYELSDASRARSTQLVLSRTRVTIVQWTLNIFLSAIVVTGLALLSLPNNILSIFVTTTMIAAVLMILLVIYELDSMKMSEEEVSNEPYYEIVRILQS